MSRSKQLKPGDGRRLSAYSGSVLVRSQGGADGTGVSRAVPIDPALSRLVGLAVRDTPWIPASGPSPKSQISVVPRGEAVLRYFPLHPCRLHASIPAVESLEPQAPPAGLGPTTAVLSLAGLRRADHWHRSAEVSAVRARACGESEPYPNSGNCRPNRLTPVTGHAGGN